MIAVTNNLDVEVANNVSATLDATGATEVSVQIVVRTGAFSAGVLTLERSLDMLEWVGMASATTFNAEGMNTTTISAKGCKFLRLRVTTANGAALVVKVIMYAEHYGS